MEDRREDYGEFYPGGGSDSGHASGGTVQEMSSKVDRVTIQDPGDDPSLFDLRDTVRHIVRAMAPTVTMLMAMAAFGQKAQLGYLKGNAFVVTNETDAAAMAEIVAATDSVHRAALELGTTIRGEISDATNAVYEAIPSLDGLVTADRLESATNTVVQSIPDVSGYATKTQLGSATNAIYRSIEDVRTTFSASNTAIRLSMPDGSTYLDATGAVWNVHHDTYLSQWHVTYYNFNATNEIPGISSWSITYDSAPGTWSLRIPSGGVEVASYLGSETDDWVSFMLPAEGVDIPVEFARTNVYSTYYTAEDRVRFMSDPISGGSLIPDDFTTTNAVKDIVTQVVVSYTEWKIMREGVDVSSRLPQPTWNGDCWVLTETIYGDVGDNCIYDAPEDATYMRLYQAGVNPDYDPSEPMEGDNMPERAIWYTFTRRAHESNALGLARLKDMGDLPTPQGVTNIVRDLSLGGIWDAELQVWWTPRMRNGSLTYEATTNVNLNAEN